MMSAEQEKELSRSKTYDVENAKSAKEVVNHLVKINICHSDWSTKFVKLKHGASFEQLK